MTHCLFCIFFSCISLVADEITFTIITESVGNQKRLDYSLNNLGSQGVILSLFQYFSPGTDDDRFHWDGFACFFHAFLDNVRETGTTGNLHDHCRDACDIRFAENSGKSVDIILHIVKFWTPHQYGLAFQEPFMEIRIGQWCTVCCDEEICIFQKRGVWRHKPNLNRPV